MSATPRIVLRKCPDCGGALIASSGVAWMTCSACPVAVNLFRSPIERLRCRRVSGGHETGVVLPFYRFIADGKERWIPAFRSAGSDSYAMARALERRASSLTYVDAPCAVRLERGVEEAHVILSRKDDEGSSADSGEGSESLTGSSLSSQLRMTGLVELIGVSCRVDGDVVTEPLTRATVRRPRS